jgi:hypothetical protein
MTRPHGRAPRGVRIGEATPQGHRQVPTTLGILSLRGNVGAMTVEWATDGEVFSPTSNTCYVHSWRPVTSWSWIICPPIKFPARAHFRSAPGIVPDGTLDPPAEGGSGYHGNSLRLRLAPMPPRCVAHGGESEFFNGMERKAGLGHGS